MFKKIASWKIWTIESIPEGVMAHEITDGSLKEEIRKAYEARYRPPITPYTHPEKYDPFNPPKGWAYDPFYEIWIEINE